MALDFVVEQHVVNFIGYALPVDYLDGYRGVISYI